MKEAFELIAGHPALDLVNTLDWRFREDGAEELLKSYDDLLRFTQESGILKPAQIRHFRGAAGPRVLKRCLQLREAVAEICYARLDGRSPSRASVRTLERSIQAARARQQLRRKGDRFEWEWEDAGPRLPLWELALSASDLLLSETAQRVRACDNPECRWLFLDTSKNHTRRWCDMQVCGNRMKARRFKARVTTGSSARAAGRTS